MLRIDGLDELQHELRRLDDRVRAVAGTHEVSAGQLFTPRFMQTHTDHETVDEWFAASPFRIEKTEDFEAIPEEQLDEYVRSTTRFLSWDEMAAAAGKDYLEAKLLVELE